MLAYTKHENVLRSSHETNEILHQMYYMVVGPAAITSQPRICTSSRRNVLDAVRINNTTVPPFIRRTEKRASSSHEVIEFWSVFSTRSLLPEYSAHCGVVDCPTNSSRTHKPRQHAERFHPIRGSHLTDIIELHSEFHAYLLIVSGNRCYRHGKPPRRPVSNAPFVFLFHFDGNTEGFVRVTHLCNPMLLQPHGM